MKGFAANIEQKALENDNFRHVIYTAKHTQLVLMSIKPAGEIGTETHTDNDQFFHFVDGSGKVIIDGNEYNVSAGSVAIVPAGAEHNVVNASDGEPLKLYTLYSPPHHKDGITRATREDAEADAPEFDGNTTE